MVIGISQKFPGTNPKKGNTIPVFGIHVGLDLEDEAGDILLVGGDLARLGRLGLRFGTVIADAVHQVADAEGVDRGAEPDRRERSLQEGGAVERWQQFARHLDLFAQFRQQVSGDMGFEFRIIEPRDRDTFCHLVAIGAVHDVKPVMDQIIGADKVATDPDGPAGRRHRADE